MHVGFVLTWEPALLCCYSVVQIPYFKSQTSYRFVVAVFPRVERGLHPLNC